MYVEHLRWMWTLQSPPLLCSAPDFATGKRGRLEHTDGNMFDHPTGNFRPRSPLSEIVNLDSRVVGQLRSDGQVPQTLRYSA